MSDFDFRGLGVALVTPFDDKGKVDYNCLEMLVRRLVAGNADYIVVLGTTAETPALTPEEKVKIRNIVADTVDGKIPLVLGCGGNCTRTLCEELHEWDGKGYTAILSVTPFYNKPSQKGLYEHFKAVAKASPLPVLLYNVPGRTGVNMLPDTTLALAKEVPGIAGIKEASGNLNQIQEIIAKAPQNFAVISGDDALTVDLAAMGARGVISVIGNAAPNVWSRLTHLALDGKVKEAKEMFMGLDALEKMLFAEGNPAGIKALLGVMGLCENVLRLPLVPVSEQLTERIREFVVTYPNLC